MITGGRKNEWVSIYFQKPINGKDLNISCFKRGQLSKKKKPKECGVDINWDSPFNR
jgi:hypothetical protein